MAQHDHVIDNDTGANFRQDLNDMAEAIVTRNAGSSAPATTYPYMQWPDLTNGVIKRRNAANSAWVLDAPLSETLAVARTSNTELGIGDFARKFAASTTFTQTFDDCAVLGNGWFVDYRNDGTGFITLDPDSSQLIDGVATLIMAPGDCWRIYSDGTGLKTIGRSVGGFNKIDYKTAAVTALIEFDQGINPSLYDAIRFQFKNYRPTTDNANLIAIVSNDGGSSYFGSGLYQHLRDVLTAPTTATPLGDVSDDFIVLASGVGNAANEGVSGELIIDLTPFRAWWHLDYRSPAGVLMQSVGSGFLAAGSIDAVGFGFDGTSAQDGSILASGLRK